MPTTLSDHEMNALLLIPKVFGALASMMGFYKALVGFRTWREKVRKGKVNGSMVVVREIYRLLQDECGAGDRVSIFRCHNGSGIPTPGRTAYSAYPYSVGHETLHGKWMKIPLDAASAEIIHDALCGPVYYGPGEMPVGMMSLSVKAASLPYTGISCIKTSHDGTWFIQVDSKMDVRDREFDLLILASRLRDLIQ